LQAARHRICYSKQTFYKSSIKAIIILILLAGCSRPVSRPVRVAEGVKAVQVGNKEQIQWQRAKACKDKWTTDYWLSTDPNHRCCDIYRDGIVNFKDLSLFLQKYR
jgi:hypothetical protein